MHVTQAKIDYQSAFDEFDDGELTTENNVTTFEGTKTFDLLNFCEVDYVSELNSDATAEIRVRYHYSYDSQANVITLTATLMDENDNLTIDSMVGVPFVDENNELDCVFDCDGEFVLLSELQNDGLIENCGWFKNLCKKVSSAVKKVCETTIGKIGAVATVAVPAVIGVVCAVAAAPVVATVAVGALVGAGIAAGTAALSTYQQDGEVDWETVGICAGVGSAIGAVSSAAAYGVTSLIKSATQISNAIKNVESNRRTHILQDKHGWKTIGNNTWETASKAIKHTLKNGSVASYKAGNEIITASYKGKTVQVVVREVNKVLQIVNAWIKFP